jgi:hypothetical protein
MGSIGQVFVACNRVGMKTVDPEKHNLDTGRSIRHMSDFFQEREVDEIRCSSLVLLTGIWDSCPG